VNDQRFTIAAILGEAGRAAAELFRSWSDSQARAAPNATIGAIDLFAEHLRTNAAVLPVAYYCEWIDHWLMGDAVPKLLQGRHIEAACMTAAEAKVLAECCSRQFTKNEWLAMQLRQAAEGWGTLAGPAVVVVLRQILGATTVDEEVTASLLEFQIGWSDWAEMRLNVQQILGPFRPHRNEDRTRFHQGHRSDTYRAG
jgi:hypothetical protein